LRISTNAARRNRILRRISAGYDQTRTSLKAGAPRRVTGLTDRIQN